MRERSLFGSHSMLDDTSDKPKKKKKKLKTKIRSLDDLVEERSSQSKKKKKKKKRPDDSYMDAFVRERTADEMKKETKKLKKKKIKEIAKRRADERAEPSQVRPVIFTQLGNRAPAPTQIQQPQTSAILQNSSHTAQVPAPVLVPVQATKPDVENTGTAPAAKLYYADLPLQERVFKLAQDGQTNDQIAIRLNISIKQVMDIRKEITSKSLISNPRDLFARRLKNFEDCFDTMLQVFDEDPTNEVAGKSLTDFMKEMRELTAAYGNLDDPREVAEKIVNMALRPLIMRTLKTIVDGVNATAKNVTPYLREAEKQMVNDGIKNSLKTLQDSVNTQYNTSVEAIAQLFDVDLGNMLIKKEFSRSSEEAE